MNQILLACEQEIRLQQILANNGYVPHPKQLELLNDQHRYKVIRCGRRFGKSVYAVNFIISEAIEGGDYWFVAPTYRQAKEIAWRLFEKYCPKELIKKKNETELSVELVNGARISLKGADKPDSLRGVGLDGVVLDEYAFMSPYAWNVISPVLQDRKGWAIFISTPDGYNHFYNLYNIRDEDHASFHFTSYDNPYLDAAELDKEKSRMSVEKFGQEYLAEFMKKSGAVWPMFSRSIHAVARIAPTKNDIIYGWIDFGFAIGHPTSVAFTSFDVDKAHTFDGFIEEGLQIDQIDQKMRDLTNGLIVRGIYYDKARPDLADALLKKGWPMVPADKDVELGISDVAQWMQINPLTNRPRWTIADHLIKEIEQIEQYEWQEVRGEDGTYKQVPRKHDDDCPDGLRYMMHTYNKPVGKPKPIIGYTGGDPVTGFGRRPIRKRGRGIDYLEF